MDMIWCTVLETLLLHCCDSSQCCRKHLLVLMRKGVGILSTSKNAKFNEGIEAFFPKLDMEADCPASRISVLLWGWRYNCPEHEHLRLKKPGKNPTVKHKQCVCHVLWPARYDLSCNDLRSNNKGPSLTHCMESMGKYTIKLWCFCFLSSPFTWISGWTQPTKSRHEAIRIWSPVEYSTAAWQMSKHVTPLHKWNPSAHLGLLKPAIQLRPRWI